MKYLLTIAVTIICLSSTAQDYNNRHIFAHNDYERARPFYTAYDLQVGFIEADVFLENGELLVAHHKHEIKLERTLEALYLSPLHKEITKNQGFAYADHNAFLTLMVDLKTEGTQTLQALVTQLEKYPDLQHSPTLQIMISGNVPDPSEWSHYPDYISFDGRPGIPYTPAQLLRVSMISTNFKSHAKWNGHGAIPTKDRKNIMALVEDAHTKGKKLRFWATPDFENAWSELIQIRMDVIVTDKVEGLAAFLAARR